MKKVAEYGPAVDVVVPCTKEFYAGLSHNFGVNVLILARPPLKGGMEGGRGVEERPKSLLIMLLSLFAVLARKLSVITIIFLSLLLGIALGLL